MLSEKMFRLLVPQCIAAVSAFCIGQSAMATATVSVDEAIAYITNNVTSFFPTF